MKNHISVSVRSTPGARLIGKKNNLWLTALGGLAILLLIAVHSIHDVLEGAPWQHAVMPSIPILLEVMTLSLGNYWLNRRGFGAGIIVAMGIVTSSIFGWLVVVLHSNLYVGLPGTIVSGIAVGFIVWGLWFLIFRVPAIIYEARIRAAAAERIRKEAELARLRASLQPHFLLNTLNAIAGLVASEPEEARRMLVTLGDLLRDTLEEGHEIRPLGEDIAWLKRYTDILETRHQGSLRFIWDLEPGTLGFLLPRFLLQPLIENAAKHGALRSSKEGIVTISCRMTGQMLRIIVEDDGPGIPEGSSEGLGIRLVRERLRLANPGSSFQIESSMDGARAIIEIPFSPKVSS